ncbi:MAG: hypothetical protein JXB49_08710 [Bacteroidales bacterium]|nr:hypothetical protein [Bacteroidales bacterium]
MKKYYLLFLLVVCSTAIFSQEYYPHWFIFPSEYKNTVIGFSYHGYAASADAEQMFWIYKECIVKGHLYQYNFIDERFSDYYYYFPYDSLQSIKDKLILKDQFTTSIVPNDKVAIFSLDSLLTIQPDPVDISTMKTPDWINNIFWEEDGYYYATGVYSARLNINDAWKTAEERAYFEILNGVVVKIYQVKISNLSENQDDLEIALAVELNFKLKNIEVVERWPDNENKMFYVNVRIKVKDIFSPLLNED